MLIQKSDSDGFGLGSGGAGGGGMFSARGQANFLTRSTAILATLFILNSLALSIIAANSSDRGSLADRLEQAERMRGLSTVSDAEVEEKMIEKGIDPAAAEGGEAPAAEESEPVAAPAAPQAE